MANNAIQTLAPNNTTDLSNKTEPLTANNPARDILTLSQQIPALDAMRYEDFQRDQAMFDSFQRWPYLFSLAMTLPTSR